jgi:hypothetical protein
MLLRLMLVLLMLMLVKRSNIQLVVGRSLEMAKAASVFNASQKYNTVIL